ncbi:TetR/AcrR family transcriptional regulator [Streptosporangium sp. NBC_01756]|uniref:TetR/AcrR family transcriptional regulator n=1 Tax=Streptosporangium sp. NBC_01756 TaxID=2975950 RepID=UPI002DD9F0AB|nr:TetR/AcrR family transcriptional regulator [Streptosporangium sp. NBC_01756]WSC88986.1 TetR/AcrR family transcriptional regulator [Streptosporangium sp. NBC_01756]
MGVSTPSRRERLRAETAAEIKTVALRLMAEGGPDAITLRAIAREMGMTAGAIYGYYETRDTLVSALITDVYTSLVDTVEAARDAVPADDAAGRILAWGQTLREWALANPEGFRLIYGDPVPGYQVPEGGAAAEAAHRACAGLTGLVAAAWPQAVARQPGGYDWTDFDPILTGLVRAEFPGLPPAAVALALRVWGRMHGLVALEVYGHLRGQTRDAGRVYLDELRDLTRSLGLGERSAAPA